MGEGHGKLLFIIVPILDFTFSILVMFLRYSWTGIHPTWPMMPKDWLSYCLTMVAVILATIAAILRNLPVPPNSIVAVTMSYHATQSARLLAAFYGVCTIVKFEPRWWQVSWWLAFGLGSITITTLIHYFRFPMIDVPPYCILMLFGFDPLSLPKIIPGLRGLCRSRPIAITCLAIVILVPIVAVIWIVISFTVMRNMDEIWKEFGSMMVASVIMNTVSPALRLVAKRTYRGILEAETHAAVSQLSQALDHLFLELSGVRRFVEGGVDEDEEAMVVKEETERAL